MRYTDFCLQGFWTTPLFVCSVTFLFVLLPSTTRHVQAQVVIKERVEIQPTTDARQAEAGRAFKVASHCDFEPCPHLVMPGSGRLMIVPPEGGSLYEVRTQVALQIDRQPADSSSVTTITMSTGLSIRATVVLSDRYGCQAGHTVYIYEPTVQGFFDFGRVQKGDIITAQFQTDGSTLPGLFQSNTSWRNPTTGDIETAHVVGTLRDTCTPAGISTFVLENMASLEIIIVAEIRTFEVTVPRFVLPGDSTRFFVRAQEEDGRFISPSPGTLVNLLLDEEGARLGTLVGPNGTEGDTLLNVPYTDIFSKAMYYRADGEAPMQPSTRCALPCGRKRQMSRRWREKQASWWEGIPS